MSSEPQESIPFRFLNYFSPDGKTAIADLELKGIGRLNDVFYVSAEGRNKAGVGVPILKWARPSIQGNPSYELERESFHFFKPVRKYLQSEFERLIELDRRFVRDLPDHIPFPLVLPSMLEIEEDWHG